VTVDVVPRYSNLLDDLNVYGLKFCCHIVEQH
jgi:hypothetical protein